jgi:hypothetical protein
VQRPNLLAVLGELYFLESTLRLIKPVGVDNKLENRIYGSRIAITVPIGKYASKVWDSARNSPEKLYTLIEITWAAPWPWIFRVHADSEFQ